MLSYICTEKDKKLRDKIGIPMWFGSVCQQWGTKSGSRQVFKERYDFFCFFCFFFFCLLFVWVFWFIFVYFFNVIF
jgi:hypothetical protein